MKTREPEERDALCPVCGAAVQSVRSAEGLGAVTVLCPNCGRLELSKEEFGVLENEMSDPD
jgi:rubredoxin